MNKTYLPGEKIEVVATEKFSGISHGEIGVVEEDLGSGCAVYFDDIKSYKKNYSATIYLSKSEIKPANDTQAETKNH